MKRRRTTAVLVLTVAVLVALGYAGGCASTTLPPALSTSQRELIQTTRFASTVGVERFKFPVYSERLSEILRATQLFDRVDELEEFKAAPDLVARIERTIHGKATIPCLTGISLGLVPTTVREEHGYSFSLSRVDGLADAAIPIEFSYSGPSTLGWYCLILNLSPSRTWGEVDKHRRFRDGLAWAVVAKRDQIRALAKRPAA